MADLNATIDRAGTISRQVATLLDRRVRSASGRYAKRMQGAARDLGTRPPRNPLEVGQDALRYAVDAMQRTLLFWDTMRERGNAWIAHERAGKPPLLHNDWEMLADARTFERPCNYALLRIIPPRDIGIDERQQAVAAELRQLLPLPRKTSPAPRGARGRASAKQSTASRRGGRSRRARKTG